MLLLHCFPVLVLQTAGLVLVLSYFLVFLLQIASWAATITVQAVVMVPQPTLVDQGYDSIFRIVVKRLPKAMKIKKSHKVDPEGKVA